MELVRFVIVILLLLLFAIFIEFISITVKFIKNKNSKIKFILCREKPPLWVLIYFIIVLADRIWRMWRVSDFIAVDKKDIYMLILAVILIFIETISIPIILSSITLIHEDFIDIGNVKMRFGEINYVEIFKPKGIMRFRKVEISENGKVKVTLSMSNKSAEKLAEIFRGKCRVILN